MKKRISTMVGCGRVAVGYEINMYNNIKYLGKIIGGGGGSRTRVTHLDFITFFYTPFCNYLISLLPHFYRKCKRELNPEPRVMPSLPESKEIQNQETRANRGGKYGVGKRNNGNGEVYMFDKKNVNDETERGTFYKFMIDILEEQDWDCQAECMGEDSVYDNILKERYPSWFD